MKSKFFMIVLAALFFVGCTSNSLLQPDTKHPENKIVVGSCSWQTWQKFAGWAHYDSPDYTPNDSLAKIIGASALKQDLNFTLYAGSWCGDSKSEVPKIYALFQASGLLSSKINLYGLTREKKETTGSAESNNISRVPTLVVFKNGKELGRIVEYPKESWAKDLLAIIGTN